MLSRSLTTKIAFILDELIPPLLRDAKWFMWIPFRMLFGNKAQYFFQFKERAFGMSPKEFTACYKLLADSHIQRKTDLNSSCIDAILRNLVGETVLEVGCGRGFLAQKLAEKVSTSACDMVISENLRGRFPDVEFKEAKIEALPYEDSAFDTVISTHTLEHVQNLTKAIAELRRVCGKRLIIVVPKQRPYKYTFDLHLHFFPYAHSLMAYMSSGPSRPHVLQMLDGDWYYHEDNSADASS